MEFTYSIEKRQFILLTTREERDIPKSAGFKWDPLVRRWWTHDPVVANKLVEYADWSALKAIERGLKEVEELAADSSAIDADIEIPVPHGLEYLPYQRAGIAYALKRAGCLIADEAGLGKKVQAIGVANASGARRILVIAPKVALRNWIAEAEKWLVEPRASAIWTATKQPRAELVAVGYEAVAKPAVAAAIRAVDWDLMIADEAHVMRTPKEASTRAVLGGGWLGDPDRVEAIKAKRRLFLTSAPIFKRPIDIHAVLKSLGVREATDRLGFEERYCDKQRDIFGSDNSGASNIEELEDRLRAQVMIRRFRSDLLAQLPAKRHSLVTLAADNTEIKAAIKAEKAALKVNAATPGDIIPFSHARHMTALAKVPAVVEHLKVLLSGTDRPILVIAHHDDVVGSIAHCIAATGYNPAVVTSDTSDDDRMRAQDDIQSRRKRVFVGSMQSCGADIKLTAASIVVFAEQDWTPGVMQQAEDMARSGQTHNLLVQHLVVDGTIEQDIAITEYSKPSMKAQALYTPETVENVGSVDTDTVDAVEAINVAEATETAVAVETATETDETVEAAVTAEEVEAEASWADATDEANVTHVTQYREVAPAAEPCVTTKAPAKRGRGRSPTGNAVAGADRVRKWRASHSVSKIELSGALADRLRAARNASGLTTEALLAAAMDALDRETALTRSASSSSEPLGRARPGTRTAG